jgi:hypothetical protein
MHIYIYIYIYISCNRIAIWSGIFMYINYKHYFVMAKGILQFLCQEEADESVIPVRTKIQQGKT